jgi:preprotein translocase SecE subunit
MGLYKPGQGYWVRVLTAVGAGIVTLYAAMWGWNQAEIVRLPAESWALAGSATEGEAQAGDTAVLLRYEGEELTQFGTARIAEFTPGSARRVTLSIDAFDSHATRDAVPEVYRIIVGDPLTPAFRADIVSTTATPVVPQLYLQAGVASALILLGTLLIGYLVAINRSSSDFLIATDAEMKKVNWTTYKQVRGSTIVVIVAFFLIAGILFVIDLGFSNFFKAINVLET